MMAAQFTDASGDLWIVSEAGRFSPATIVRPGDPIPEATAVMLVFERVRDQAQRMAGNVPLDWRDPRVLARAFAISREITDR